VEIPKIIFEDDYILVINKPSGLVVNRAESVKVKTLQDWLDEKLAECQIIQMGRKDPRWRSGIVHRLDKDTSGVLVVVKDTFSFQNLQSQFKERKVVKKYLALVHNKVEPKKGSIRLPLARSLKDRKKFAVRLRGKRAETFYEVKKYFQKENREYFTFLEVQPKTGRTHQLRVHLKYIGYPIVADPFYLNKKMLLEDNKFCHRLFLHAEYLSFFHPKTREKIEFYALLPLPLKNVLKKITR